jgi:hypothetical protein
VILTISYIGMVRKSWIREHSGGYFKTVPDLPWWKTFDEQITPEDISAIDQQFLDELPDDTPSEEEENN